LNEEDENWSKILNDFAREASKKGLTDIVLQVLRLGKISKETIDFCVNAFIERKDLSAAISVTGQGEASIETMIHLKDACIADGQPWSAIYSSVIGQEIRNLQ
jgi:hypothetical protein